MSLLSLIVAMDENRLIGRDNGLPWQLPADLAHFKRVTMGKPVVMGRKTHASIGRPLPGRRNLVVTSNPDYDAPGCEIAADIDAALEACGDADEVMLIGGATLYAQTLPRADRLYVTLIHHRFSGDTWFPEFDTAAWRVESRQDFAADHGNPYPYSFIIFIREF